MGKNNFVWGVATSAFQIEGKDPEFGNGRSVWDTFCEKKGAIKDGSNGDVACDHIHRYKEDFALMRELGIKHYRFSLNWARIMPEGTGYVDQKMIDVYRDMVLEMKKNGITPYITLFHWEYPQALQDKGGWLNDDSSDWFAEYAGVVADNFTDICEYFITLNEPQCFVGVAHYTGEHAPGLKLGMADGLHICHNALKAHGKAVMALRERAKQPIKIGYAPTCGVAVPYTDSPEDIEAARESYFGNDWLIDTNWAWTVSWFSDPVFLGHYPEEALKKYAKYLPVITEEDMKIIHQPLDFMGQNIYTGHYIKRGEDGKPEYVPHKEDCPVTGMGWPVVPESMYWGPKFLYERYGLPVYITENGAAYEDVVEADGSVNDSGRAEFLKLYIDEIKRGIADETGIAGYFLWSFMDNFEWAHGYTKRFGIVHVDFETQKRTPKASALWYKTVCEE